MSHGGVYVGEVLVTDTVGEGVMQRYLSPIMPFTLPLISQSIFSPITSMKLFHSCCSYMSFSNLEFLSYPSVPLTWHLFIPPCKMTYFITSVTIFHHLNSKFISVSSAQQMVFFF